MSLALQLDPINLTSGPDKLKLRVDSVLHLDVPEGTSQLSKEQTFLALADGKLWATRGRNCCFDFYIHWDDEEFLNRNQNHIVESLGNRLQNSYFWTQLSLSASLDIPQSDDTNKISFSLRLGPKKPPSSSSLPQEDWLAGNIDVQPPGGVRRATVEKVQVQLKVQVIRDKSENAPKRSKATSSERDTMLLDTYLDNCEGFLTNICENIPRILATSSEILGSGDLQYDSQLPQQAPLWNHESIRFQNSIDGPEDMLLAPCEVPFKPLTEEADMLLSQSFEAAPPLHSQSSTTSTLSSQTSSFYKRPLPSDSPVILAEPIQKFVEVAVHTLMTGRQVRRPKAYRDIVARPPHPTHSLARLCPGIFGVGFKEVMASNNQFITTITRTISVSWPQNVQSPTLLKKLDRLAHQSNDANDSRQGGIPRNPLSTAVSSSLWAMMQRNSYLATSSRQLAWEFLDNMEHSSGGGLLESQSKPLDAEELENTSDFEDMLAKGDENYDEDLLDFESLLAEDHYSDDGLLHLLVGTAEENIQTEHETDEILFGQEEYHYQESDDTILLLEDIEDHANEKYMLV
ncbi:hypothetical protein HYALB_00007092 [Hymenoscyphus albidus]|uniref:Uncharacterized protein n=1 Tax=Hymenoscyphus albidus TaxID=595503 RepID=A0A9N9LYZ2_9HELO|nr:hypothetical protein HYALB_00007092 [Hymenoscyphus albidus]